MSNDKIKKGKHILRMKIASGKHLENPDWDLMKIPLEALHSAALQQIGEQEAYIEELEANLKEITESVRLTRQDEIKIMEETRRESVIVDIWQRYLKAQQRNGSLKKKYCHLSRQYCCILNELSSLKEKFKQYEEQH